MDTQTQIKLRLTEGAIETLESCTSREERGRLLVTMINEKIEELQTWSKRYLGDEMTKFEVAAIRTFLYREVTGELGDEGDVMRLPRVHLNEHPASAV